MIRRRLIFVLGWLLMSANLSFAAISTTQQNFDDFSFDMKYYGQYATFIEI